MLHCCKQALGLSEKKILQPADLIVYGEGENMEPLETCSVWAMSVRSLT
jgi:hypothetical protein